MTAGQSIDSINRRRRAKAALHPANHAHVPKKKINKRHGFFTTPLRIMTLLLFFAGVSTVGIVSQTIAEFALIGYGIMAIARHIPSQITFLMALVSLILIPVISIAGFVNYASAFSSYAFLFLTFGTICLGRELSRD